MSTRSQKITKSPQNTTIKFSYLKVSIKGFFSLQYTLDIDYEKTCISYKWKNDIKLPSFLIKY